MARRNDHSKEELQALIFNAAKKIVEKKGYQELSARKLAEKISYTPGTIYSFYKNIDDLVMHINAATLEDLYELLKKEILKATKAEKKLQAISETYINYSLKNHNLCQLLFDYHYKDENKIPNWYEEKVQQNFSLVEEVILSYTKCQQESTNLARVLWASLHGIVILSLRGKLSVAKADSAHALAECFIKNFLAGLKA